MLHFFLFLLTRLVTSVSNNGGLYHVCFVMETAMPNGIDTAPADLANVLATNSFWTALNFDMNDLQGMDTSLLAPLFANQQQFCMSHRTEIEEIVSAVNSDDGTSNEHAENMLGLMIAEMLLVIQDAEVIMSSHSEGSRRNLVVGLMMAQAAELGMAGMEIDQAGVELNQVMGNPTVMENWELANDLRNTGNAGRLFGIAPEPVVYNPALDAAMNEVVGPSWRRACMFWCPTTVAATGFGASLIHSIWGRRNLETSSYDITVTADSIVSLCLEGVNSFICNVDFNRLVALLASDLCGTAETGVMTCTITDATIEHEMVVQRWAIAHIAGQNTNEVKIAEKDSNKRFNAAKDRNKRLEVKIAAEKDSNKRLKAANKALRDALAALA